MKYFSLKNLSSVKVEDMKEPYATQREYPKEFKDGKNHKKFIEWRQNINTSWQFFSLVEGINPHQRVSSEGTIVENANAIKKVHGVVLDFDCHDRNLAWGEETLKGIEKELLPTWINLTFRKGFRLVWEFSEPILCPTTDMYKEFIRLFCEATRAQVVFPSLDMKAAQNATMFYDRGREWKRINPEPISQLLIEGLFLKAGETALWRTSLGEPPIEEIAKLVQKRFPNKWQGEFIEGARGCRFWDTQADNQTAALVRRSGMQCFTGEVPFKTWKDIFGPADIAALTAESTASVIADFYYDGQAYHSYNPITGRYRCIHRIEELRLFLKEYYKVHKDKLGPLQARIEEERRIDMAIPLPFLSQGIHYDSQGARLLNISRLQLLPPAVGESGAWGKNFPRLADFLDQMFRSVNPGQLAHFLGYMSYFYKACYEHRKTKGQVTFIAGPPGTGKSFLVNAVIGPIFGGVVPAGSYLVDQDQYNDHLFKSNVWVLDDEMGNADSRVMARYSNMLKQIAANYNLRYRPMYSSGGSLSWFGRLFVTLNEDYKSLEILPDMDINNRDKINFYRVGKTDVDFPLLCAAYPAEIPYFCRYLLDYVIPAGMVDSRFGVKAYQEGEVLKRTDVGGRTNMDSEIFREFRRQLFSKDEYKKKEYLYFTPLQIFSLVQSEALIATQTARSHWSSAFKFHRLLFSLEKDIGYLRSVIQEGKADRAYFIMLAPNTPPEKKEEIFAKAQKEIQTLPQED